MTRPSAAPAAERTAARRTAIAAVLGRASWIALAMGAVEISSIGGGGVPPFAVLGVRFVLPLAIVALAFALFKLHRVVSDPALQPSLIAVQAFRVSPIGIELAPLALHAMPAPFVVPAGIGDVSIGLTAIWVRRLHPSRGTDHEPWAAVSPQPTAVGAWPALIWPGPDPRLAAPGGGRRRAACDRARPGSCDRLSASEVVGRCVEGRAVEFGYRPL